MALTISLQTDSGFLILSSFTFIRRSYGPLSAPIGAYLYLALDSNLMLHAGNGNAVGARLCEGLESLLTGAKFAVSD